MVQIPNYQAQQGLDAPSYPRVHVDDSIGQGLRALGGAISDIVDYTQARQKKKDAFDAALGLDRLNEQYNQALVEAERSAPADGSGLFQKYNAERVAPLGDAFLSTIKDPELKAEYQQRLGLLQEKWRNDAANREYGLGNKYSQDGIDNAWQSRSQGIAQNPAAAKEYIAEMERLIDTAPNLTAVQREEMKTKVRSGAPAIVASALQQTDPEALYFASGNGANSERLQFLTRRLVPAVQAAENGPRDPRAVSKDGAIGLMQVTLGAAEDVAKKIGDKQFLRLDPAQRTEYLMQPDVNMRYGAVYLDMMVGKYGGDVEAALIAYNAGSGNADKWLEAGRDYAILPRRRETEPYVQKVLANLGAAKLASGTAAAPGKARIPVVTGTQPGRQPLDMSGLKPEVIDRWERVQGAFGRAVPIVSAYRDKARNNAAGGAKGSQHLHGNAIDVDVAGMTRAERVRLIETASAMGFTGIGVYANSLHFDTGGRRAWGPSHSFGSVPPWAYTAIAKHVAGKIEAAPETAFASDTGIVPGEGSPIRVAGLQRSGFVSDVFADMPAPALLQVQHGSADLRIKATDQAKQEKAIAKVNAERLIENDLASIAQTGEGAIAPADLDAKGAEVFNAVGPEAYAAWQQDRALAQRTYNLTSDADTLTNEAMTARLAQLAPRGGPDAAVQQKLYDKVKTRFDEVQKLRTDDPGLAVLQTPALRDAASSVDWSQPASVKTYLDQVDAAQTMLGMERTLLPKAQAEQLGQQIRNVLQANPGLEKDATQALLGKLEAVYGTYADDVFTQAYETLLDKDLTKDTRAIVSDLVTEWVRGAPGMADSRYHIAQELIATDRQPPPEETKTSRSAWEWFTGAPPVEPKKPEPVYPTTPQPPAIKVEGAPPEAVDVYMRNAGNPKIQAMFRDFYGAGALKDMQRQLRERGAFGGRN